MTRIRPIAAAVVAGALIAVAGCKSQEETPASKKAFIGIWNEQDETPQSGGVIVLSSPRVAVRRQVEFRADGTYQMRLVDKQGKLLSPPQTADGTWKLVGAEVQLTPGASTLRDNFQNWAITTFVLVTTKAAGAERDQLDLKDAGDVRITFYRADETK